MIYGEFEVVGEGLRCDGDMKKERRRKRESWGVLCSRCSSSDNRMHHGQ